MYEYAVHVKRVSQVKVASSGDAADRLSVIFLEAWHHSRCPSDVLIPDQIFACHSAHPP